MVSRFAVLWASCLVAISVQARETLPEPRAQVEFRQESSPLGLFPTLSSQVETSTEQSTIVADRDESSLRFIYWELNGVRQDTVGNSPLNPVRFTIFEATLARALYIDPTLDADGDGVPDWWEYQSYTSLTQEAASDTDADGFPLSDEYARRTKPTFVNLVQSGAVAFRRSNTITAILGTNDFRYAERSAPIGVLASSTQVLPLGAVKTTQAAPLTSDTWLFSHWSINGARQATPFGTSLERVSVLVTGTTTAVAHYIDAAQVADTNDIPDWYELRYLGQTGNHPDADHDGDGFTLSMEYARRTHPAISNQVRSGVIAMRISNVHLKDFDPNDTDADGIPDAWEIAYYGHIHIRPSDDTDSDGFPMQEEYARRYSPTLSNRVESGTVAFRKSPVLRANLVQWPTYLIQSRPRGVIEDESSIVSPGTIVQVPALHGERSGYDFAYWALNGARQTDGIGTSLNTFSLVVTADTTCVALYIPSNQDADDDDVPDLYELTYYGSTDTPLSTDSDGDGLTLAEEYARRTNPLLVNDTRSGSVALRKSNVLLADLQSFARSTLVLTEGIQTRFFSEAPPTNGTFSVIANAHPAAGDWDGDGDLDLFVGGAGGVLHVFENFGSPVIMNLVDRTADFAGGSWTNIASPAPSLGDFSGDGFEDLAVGGDTNRIWLHASTGSFSMPPSTVFELSVSDTTVAIPAFIGPDLLVLRSDGFVSHYTNLPSAHLSTTDYLGVPVPNARGISVSDVNRDTIPDVLVSDDNGRIWEFHGE